MGIAHLNTTSVATEPKNGDEVPRKSRTPEERRVTVCPNCFLALPAATERCFYCE